MRDRLIYPRLLILACWLVLSPSALGGLSNVYPPPPPGRDVPAGDGNLPFTQQVSPEVPQVSAITDNAGPGDTLVMTGAGLTDARLQAWAGGEVVPIEPLRRDDQRMIAVMPPGFGTSVTFIWPVSEAGQGLPIRVNAPAAWWAWPRRIDPAGSAVLRIFGRNLITGDDTQPVVMVAAEGQPAREVQVLEASVYELAVEVPPDLDPGRYRLWVYNGTGGAYGWSEPIEWLAVSAVGQPPASVRLDDELSHGDARQVIQQAIHDIQARGGGTIRLGPGVFDIARPIVVPPGPPVHFLGAGAGDWDPDAGEPIDPTGAATILRYPDHAPGLVMFDIKAPGSSLCDLALICESDVPNSAIRLNAPDLSVKRCLVVRTREDSATAGIHAAYRGDANHVIESCKIYGVSSCIRIGRDCDYVRITGCVLRGGFTRGSTTSSNAVVNQGGNQMILEHCDARGIDRTHGKVLARTCLLYHSSIRNTFIAHNHSADIGPHPSVPGVIGNTGEQYLFHRQGDRGGRFTVTAAWPAHLVIDGGLPRAVNPDGDWIAFIDSGTGAGQWRTIVGRPATDTVVLDRPWRIAPGPGSAVLIQQAFRHNVVYRNTIEAPVDPGPGMKRVGVYLYQLAFENIVAENTLDNLAVGVAIACDHDAPSAWNLVRGNTIRNAFGYAGGTAELPMFLNEHARGLNPAQREGIAGWIGLGNTFRANACRRAPAAAAVGWLRGEHQKADGYRIDRNHGLVMTVFEHNTFEDAQRGVLLNAPSNWTVLRGNRHTGEAAGNPTEAHHRTVLDPLIEP